MTARASPIEVAKREFGIDPIEPYYFVALGDVRSDQRLRAVLDTETRLYEPDSFPGLLYAPAFMDAVFLFLKSGRVVDLTSDSVETANRSFETLFEHLEAIGAITASPDRELRTVKRDVLSTAPNETQEDGDATGEIDLSIDFEKIRKQLVAIPLFEPRDRLHFPQSDITIRLPSESGPGSTRYSYHETSGTLDLETSPDGDAFLGLDSEHEVGVLFTREELVAVFDHHGGSPVETDWAKNNAVIVSSRRDVSNTTIHVFAADGSLTYHTEQSRVADIAIGDAGRVAAYTHGHKPPVLTICECDNDGSLSTVEVEGYARVRYADETEEFFVGPTSDGVFTKALSTDGAVLRELGPNEVETRVERFLSQRGNVPLYEVRRQVQQDPSRFVSAIPDLVERLIDDGFAVQHGASVAEIFRALAREQPTAFTQHLDALFGLLADPTVPYQAESADKVIRELHAANIQRDTIVERLHRMVEQGDGKQRERAVRLFGTRTVDLSTHEETLNLLVGSLDEQMDPQLMLPTVDALQNATVAKAENPVLAKLVTDDRVGILVELLRFGHDRRGRDENALSMGVSIEDDGTETDEKSLTRRETELDDEELYYLNERTAALLEAIAKVHPDAVTPQLGRLLLDLKTEAESLENVRGNALDIIEALLDGNPESLSAAVDRHSQSVVELVAHSETPIGEAALRLLSRSRDERGNEVLREIASTPSHRLWQIATALTESEFADHREKDDTGHTIERATARLRQLPSDVVTTLHLPSPDELQEYRTTAGLDRAQLGHSVGLNRHFLEALEEGVLNPPLSALVEVAVHVAPDDTLLDEFPTGARLRTRRRAIDVSTTTLADRAGLSDHRLQAIEDGTADPRAHEIERVLIAIGDAEEPASYPDRPSLREAWIEYGTALARELGRLPKSSELIEQPGTAHNGSGLDREPGFDGDEDISPDVSMPETPHWAVFDSWDDLLADLEVGNEYRTSGAPLRASLLEDLRSVADQVSGLPTTTAIDEHGTYSYHYYKKEFGGIRAAREAAGLNSK
ncbi:homing endonuclease associated repeat-containing protein [Halomicrobium salinisoli]|uniref:homing endonuclease associated repeat-containing protein n=1 Tax=Halomicrobium salinisoli TaxID=2878391 RepID=UPI001CF065D6|nr:hypothetical protein [Halomicrobium salinisoli]